MGSLMDAYNYIVKNGWVKGLAVDRNGSVCAIGACSQVDVAYDNYEILDEVALEQYPDRASDKKEEFSLRPVAQFNDHPDTTLEDVRVVFEKAQLRTDEQV